MKYKVAKDKVILHSREQKYYYGGEEIDLSHLSPEQIKILLDAGVIEVVEQKQKEKHNG